MKRVEYYRCCVGRLLWLLLTLLSANVIAKPGEIIMGNKEQTFPLLETKTGAYTNVTVTKKTKEWVFILHSQGVCNVRASDLSTQARIALGYEEAPKTPDQLEAVPAESSAKMPHIDLAEVKQFAADWKQDREGRKAAIKAFVAANVIVIGSILGIVVVLHLMHSALFWMICRKTHIAPGPLIWIPILQLDFLHAPQLRPWLRRMQVQRQHAARGTWRFQIHVSHYCHPSKFRKRHPFQSFDVRRSIEHPHPRTGDCDFSFANSGSPIFIDP